LPELGPIAELLKMVESHFGRPGVAVVKVILVLVVIAIFISLVNYIKAGSSQLFGITESLGERKADLDRPPSNGPSSSPLGAPSPGRPVLVKPPQSLALNADGTERIFVHSSPEEIHRNYEGHTEDQAKALNAPYFLKWMAISGIVQNAVTDARGVFVDFTSTQTILSGAYSVQLNFGPSWKEKLSILKVGDALNAVCRISDIGSIGMALDQCEAFDPAERK
jgi:hypothetical protein